VASLALGEPWPGENRQQVADLLLVGERIAKRQVGLDRVVVAPPVPPSCYVTGVGQLTHDSVRRTLGDPDGLADLAQPDAGVLRYAQQHARVVRQERPGGGFGLRHQTQ
jgi:hypothetical protein